MPYIESIAPIITNSKAHCKSNKLFNIMKVIWMKI